MKQNPVELVDFSQKASVVCQVAIIHRAFVPDERLLSCAHVPIGRPTKEATLSIVYTDTANKKSKYLPTLQTNKALDGQKTILRHNFFSVSLPICVIIYDQNLRIVKGRDEISIL